MYPLSPISISNTFSVPSLSLLVHINFLYWLLLVCRVLFCATHSLTNNQKESRDSLFTCSVFYSVEWFTLFTRVHTNNMMAMMARHAPHAFSRVSSVLSFFSPCYTWWMGKVLQNGFKKYHWTFFRKVTHRFCYHHHTCCKLARFCLVKCGVFFVSSEMYA